MKYLKVIELLLISKMKIFQTIIITPLNSNNTRSIFNQFNKLNKKNNERQKKN
jgi:hypothetical protein